VDFPLLPGQLGRIGIAGLVVSGDGGLLRLRLLSQQGRGESEKKERFHIQDACGASDNRKSTSYPVAHAPAHSPGCAT
jgi:hypothetical protein